MSELEIITLSLSLILGLSVAQMLSAVAQAIRARRDTELHWVPLGWATAIFIFHVQFWFAVFGLDEVVPAWTWDWFGPILVMAVLLFLSGALVLPTREKDLARGLLGDFEVHGRLSLIPISLYLLMWIPMNVRMGAAEWLSADNAVDVILVALAVVAFLARRPATRNGALAAYLLVEAWGVFVVWSPGAAA
jgi:hypothetical protein